MCHTIDDAICTEITTEATAIMGVAQVLETLSLAQARQVVRRLQSTYGGDTPMEGRHDGRHDAGDGIETDDSQRLTG